jgi:hypothetical protein
MSTKTDYQGTYRSSQTASHVGVAGLAGDVWDIKQNVPVILTVATTLTMSDTGKVFSLQGASAGANITLPAVGTSAGFKAKFWVGKAFATTAWTITALTNVIQGSFMVAGAVVACASQGVLTFAYGAETLGDWIELECDGTSWLVFGNATASSGITTSTV